jgi:hypothetical protein
VVNRETQFSPELQNRRQRKLLIIGIILYVASFQWVYVHYLNPNWEYFGFVYVPPSSGYLVLAWILSVLPSLWMPVDVVRPSQLTYWVIYLIVFVPSMFVPLYAGLNSSGEVAVLMIAMFAGFVFVGSSYRMPLARMRSPMLSTQTFWRVFACIAICLVLWMLFVFRHHLSIGSLEDIADVRAAQNELSEGKLVNYAFMLLTGAINPFLMGWGLYNKRGWLFMIGALGQVLVYAVGATKGSLASIIFIPSFYFLLRKGRYPFGLKLTYGTLVLVAILCLSLIIVNYEPGPVHTVALFVVLMRTLSVDGLETAQYYDFFKHNPLTYYSHVKGINMFVHYPYSYPVGQEIGLAYAGTTELDQSAHFWATDGIGGLGLPGILIMGAFCALVFWVLDSASQRHDSRMAALVTTYAAYNIADISIFTSLLSGGLIVLIVFLHLMPPAKIRNKLDTAGTLAKARAVNGDGVFSSAG